MTKSQEQSLVAVGRCRTRHRRATSKVVTFPCVAVIRTGGAGSGPGARSYAGWVNTRMDVFCFAGRLNNAAAVAQDLHERVDVAMLEMTRHIRKLVDDHDDEGTVLVSASAAGGPIDRVSPQGWDYVWSTYEVSSLRDI